MLSFGFIIAAQAVDGFFFAGDFIPNRNRFQIDRDLIIEKWERSKPVNDAGVSLLRPPFNGKEGVIMAIEIKRRFIRQADTIALPTKFLNRQLRLIETLEIDFEPVGKRRVKEPLVIGEVLQVGHR